MFDMQTSFHFSPLDEIMPAVEETALLTFPMSQSASKQSTFAVLTEGLARLLADRPFLSGRIVRESERTGKDRLRAGHLRMEMPESSPKTQITLNDMTTPGHPWQASYQELAEAGMPSSMLEREVIGPKRTIQQSPLKVQVNFIHGGCLIFICSSHVFVDAWGFYVMVDTWAGYCRQVQEQSLKIPTTLDEPQQDSGVHPALTRQVSSDRYQRLKQRTELWEMLGLDWRPYGQSSATLSARLSLPEAVRTCVFTLDPPSLAKLKAEAAVAASQRAEVPISTNDALLALLWRCILKIRVSGGKKLFLGTDESMHMVAVNARKQLSPPVPLSYIGNVVLYSMVKLPISLLTSPETSIATIARALRESIDTHRNPDLVRDAIDLATGIPDVRHLSLAFPTWLGENLVTSSILSIPFYEVDFGRLFGESGKADFFRYPKGGFEGLCFVMPRKIDGIVEIHLSMEGSQMDALMNDSEFIEYAKLISE